MGQKSMHHDKPLKNLNRKNSLCSKSCSIDESQKVNLEGVHRDSSKSKSQSVQNTTHPNNPIYKVTMAKTIYLMSVRLKDPPMLLEWNLMWFISISTNPCREVLIQSIVGSPRLVLNLKPSWSLSQSQGYLKKMGKYAPVWDLMSKSWGKQQTMIIHLCTAT